MSERVIEYRRARVHLEQAGSGEPLLFLHGAGGGRIWGEFHDNLAERFEVIAPDLPGFSRSEQPAWLDGMDDLVYFSLELMDELGFPTFNVVGESLGGWLAAEVAVHHPERVRTLSLLAPIGLEIPHLAYADLFAMSPAEVASAVFFDSSKAASLLPSTPDEDVILEAYKNNGTFARLAWTNCFANPKLGERLYRVTVPALLAWGAHDKVAPLAYAERWSELIPQARLEILESCGHAIVLEQPDPATALVFELAGVEVTQKL